MNNDAVYIKPVPRRYKFPELLYGDTNFDTVPVRFGIFWGVAAISFLVGVIGSIVCLCLRIGPPTGDEQPLGLHLFMIGLFVWPILMGLWFGSYEHKYARYKFFPGMNEYKHIVSAYKDIRELGMKGETFWVAHGLMLETNNIVRIADKTDVADQLKERDAAMCELLKQRKIEIHNRNKMRIEVQESAALDRARTLLEQKKIAAELPGGNIGA